MKVKTMDDENESYRHYKIHVHVALVWKLL